MKILHVLMRFYSYVFTLVPAAFLTGLGIVAYVSGQHTWKIDTLPWTGQDISTAALILGLFGLAAIPLAAFNWFRWLLPVMTFVYAGFLIYGFFWQSYRFQDADEFKSVLWFTAAAVISFLCSLLEFKRGKK